VTRWMELVVPVLAMGPRGVLRGDPYYGVARLPSQVQC